MQNMGFHRNFNKGRGNPYRRGRKVYSMLNCMSYALDLDKWGGCYSRKFLKPDKHFFKSMRENGFIECKREDMVMGKVYVVYRFGRDDFHWAIRNETGHWRHKCGSSPSESVSERVVFSKKWETSSFEYTSRVYLFVKA